MKVLYLGSAGPTNIRMTRDGFVIGDSAPVPPPEFEYDTILIGNTKGFVSYAALKALGKWGITVGFLGRGGTPLSTFVPWARRDAPLRLAQMKAALDPKVCVVVARALVEAKTGEPVPKSADTVQRVRNVEGARADAYWSALGVNRRSGYSKSLNFKATSPINASINFAQGVLAVRCRAVIGKVGLDEAISFLHSPTHDRASFAFDTQELSRSAVDAVAIDFARTAPASSFIRDEDWVYRLSNAAAPDLAYRVEGALNRRISYQGERVSVEGVITRELRRFGEWCRRPTPSLAFASVRPSART